MPLYPNPSVITGDDHRPDLLILTKDNCLYILELTVGYETNLRNNINRKHLKSKREIQLRKIHQSFNQCTWRFRQRICRFPKDVRRHAFR